ncbi:ClpXP adapter SpxH family protein [Macrococcoides canis]|uniref:ClpXP adapter protein SpxH n=1 Tax=Macrococcoides canis TaxID=1855823 RepID=A0A4R6C611_9STAP|nr:ClpXP adapter SpxH family protein [Macrococcus canis]MEE1108238.1 ClpXP adapter SpxH family protein [Macrococcus canis]TDM17474.1 DsbA family protein [Macrococcus canis]TDM20799.1 DsbA family protein [Macrococcus canis]TDM24652.1 DsbA family protein [Macrococcus canis]TDM32397.1 DsbA family protein [Macrococcus canis]
MNHLQLVSEKQYEPLMPKKRIEIYSFFDPFCKDSWQMKSLLRKLQIEYNQFVDIKQILLPSLKVLTKCQAQSTTNDDNIALAFKAAELQGRKKAAHFLNYIQNAIMPKQDIITKELIMHSAHKAGIDVDVFLQDIKSTHVTTSLKCDQHISNEMDVNYTPTLVFFNENFEDEGLKVEGIQNYSIYTYIISELMDAPIEKELPPKLIDYINEQELVSESELEVIYEWPKPLLINELRKLKIQRLIEDVHYDHDLFWRKTSI